MKDFHSLLQMIDAEVHVELRRAVEIGRWRDGISLSGEQRELCLQAVIAWEARNLPEQQRSGYIEHGRRHGACGSAAEPLRIVTGQGV